jgi:proteasome lid subunit RPN8/RPN11
MPEKDFEIDLFDFDLPDQGLKIIGKISDSSLVIYLDARVFLQIRRHSQKSHSIELGGFLLGFTQEFKGITSIYVTGMIEAEDTVATRASITFTHETWNKFNMQKQTVHPDKKTLGWYHTHPGYGVFLSKKDLFIHQNFFRNRNDLALVVDPTQRSIEKGWGFFQWKGHEIIKCPGFSLGSNQFFPEPRIEIGNRTPDEHSGTNAAINITYEEIDGLKNPANPNSTERSAIKGSHVDSKV